MNTNSLIGSLPIYAQHLSELTGVQVVVEGNQAWTDGGKVVVPFTERDPHMSFGYVAHECSHVRNTDMEVFNSTSGMAFRQAVLNILEDIRIEQLSMEQYPGTEEDLNYLAVKVLGDHIEPAVVEGFSEIQIIHQTLLLAGRNQVLKQALEQPATVLLKAFAGLLGKSLSDEIMQLVSGVLACNSTSEVLDLADAIIAKLPSEQDQPTPNPTPQSGQDEAEEEHGEESKSQSGAEESQPDSSDKSTEAESTPDSGQGEAEKGDKSNEDPSGGGKPQAEGKKSTGDTSNGDQPEQAPGIGDERPANKAKNLREQAMAATRKDLAGLTSDVGNKAAEMLSEKAKHDPDSGKCFSLGDRTVVRSKANSDVRIRLGTEQSSGLRQTLNGLLQAKVDCRVRLKRQGRRVDTSRIAMLKAGDTRVFRSKSQAVRQSAAIEILLDKSGSMQASLDTAEAALYAILKALDGLPLISTGAMSFPEEDRGIGVSRCSLIKAHSERLATAVHKHGFGAYPQGYTPLAEALWPAALSVLKANGERKILFVITDGKPDNVPNAKAMVRRCEMTGIEVIGLGFGGATNAILNSVFSRYRAIGEVGKLKQALFELTREVLTA